MRKRIIFTISSTVILCGVVACGILFHQSKEKPPDSKATVPLVGEFVTTGGSRLTFTNDGDNDWSTGEVLVELADDAEYLLEGRSNNTVYRYVFGMNNLPANYDVADDFQLSNGEEWFMKCHSRYTKAGDIMLDPYSPSGNGLIFERSYKGGINHVL